MKLALHSVIMASWIIHAVFLILLVAAIVLNYLKFSGVWLNFIIYLYVVTTIILLAATFKHIFNFVDEAEHKTGGEK